MEGAILLLLFSAFLVFVTYRMDQHDKRHEERSQPYEDILRDAYERGFNDGLNGNTNRLPEIFRKKRK